MTSKIHLATNALGRICRLIVGPGQQSDYTQAGALVAGYRPLIALADKGYDAQWFIDGLHGAGVATVVIPPKKNRTVQRPYDAELYKGRNVVERAINKLKFFRRIATRYEKTARNFYSLICLAAAIINAR